MHFFPRLTIVESFTGGREDTISSRTACIGDKLLLLSLLLLITELAGEGGRHCVQLLVVSSLTGVPARRLKRDSTAADVRLSTCFCII